MVLAAAGAVASLRDGPHALGVAQNGVHVPAVNLIDNAAGVAGDTEDFVGLDIGKLPVSSFVQAGNHNSAGLTSAAQAGPLAVSTRLRNYHFVSTSYVQGNSKPTATGCQAFLYLAQKDFLLTERSIGIPRETR